MGITLLQFSRGGQLQREMVQAWNIYDRLNIQIDLETDSL
jgi:hypothetical protein